MKKMIRRALPLLLLATLAGCSQPAAPASSAPPPAASSAASEEASATPSASVEAPAAPATSGEAPAPAPTPALLQQIVDEAAQGRVPGCEYALDGITIDSIEEAWGTADSSEYVAEAKGTYYTFGKENIVFGANKGMLVFEIRSYAPELGSLTRGDVIALLGSPEHGSTTAQGEAVIGYTLAYTGPATNMAPDEVKLKFVFENDKNAAPVNHYMVLDPAQTVNMMADDSGRGW